MPSTTPTAHPLPGVDDMEHVQPPTSPATSAEVDEVGDATTDPRASTPRKRRAVGQALDRNRCRVCGGGDGAHDDASYWWLGCCAKRCTYWTHQRWCWTLLQNQKTTQKHALLLPAACIKKQNKTKQRTCKVPNL